MSTDIKVKGELTIPEGTKQEVMDGIEEYELEEITQLVELLDASENTFVFNLSLHLGNHEALEFSEWLDDLLAIAQQGHLHYWAENFEENTYVLIEAGGKETVLQGPFP